MAINIRRLKERDIARLSELEKELFSDPWPERSFRNELKNSKISFSYVLEDDNQIIAYLIAWCYAGEVHIGNIAVDKTFRRRGLAERLLKHLFQECGDYEEAFLEVRESNRAAVALYLKMGFEILGVRRSYYSDGENALIMQKTKTK